MVKINLNKILVSYVMLMSVFLFSKNFVSAFDGPTHKYVTVESINIFSKMGDDYKNFYTDKAVEYLVKYCEMPDEDENDGLYKYHFYNIATGRNFMGEKMSALSKAKVHYKEALLSYKTGNLSKTWEELGRSIHFMEDLITPVHSGYDQPMDALNKLSMHVDFERKCVLVQEECHAEVSDLWLRYFVDNSLEEIGKMCSRLANDNFFALEKNYVSQEIVAYNTVNNAEKIVVGILYKFFVESQNMCIN